MFRKVKRDETIVIYTYLRAQEPGCNQGDAWEACGDEYLLEKNPLKVYKLVAMSRHYTP